MDFMIKLVFLYIAAIGAAPSPEATKLLKAVEQKYAASSGIQMHVTKKLLIPLLEKEKKSEGEIKIKKGGFFKWQTNSPEKNTIILTPEAVWVIDAPMDEMDKTIVLKSKKPKKNQSPAVVTFLMGKGGLTKNYKIVSTQTVSQDLEKYHLKAKLITEAVKELDVVIDKKNKTVSTVSFVDHIGNSTTLEFDKIEMDQKFNKTEFDFKPTSDTEITILE